jgi:hypothetical protein
MINTPLEYKTEYFDYSKITFMKLLLPDFYIKLFFTAVILEKRFSIYDTKTTEYNKH